MDKPDCHGLNQLFFSYDEEDIAKAKQICRGCKRRLNCLETILKVSRENDTDGVFGGFTANERRSIRRARRTYKDSLPQLISSFDLNGQARKSGKKPKTF